MKIVNSRRSQRATRARACIARRRRPPAPTFSTRRGRAVFARISCASLSSPCQRPRSLVIYLVPRTALVGAVLWTGYLGGAVATHVRVGSPLFSHTLFPIYVAALL